MSTPPPPATAEAEQALAHALQFDGRKAFRPSSEMMARITAAHLIEQLHKAGFAIIKTTTAPRHEAPE